MDPQILTILANILITITGSLIMFRVQMGRIPAQNAKDNMDTAKTAMEISDKATAKQLELTQKVEKLEQLLQNNRYKVVVFFSLGETPRIESASVEAIGTFQQHSVNVE